MKVRPHRLSNRDRMQYLDFLYTTAGHVRGRRDIKLFFRDLLTLSERVMLGRRIAIARMLISGSSYGEICQILHVGPDTIRRVHRWLVDEHPGYEKAVAGLESTLQKREKRHSIDRESVLALLKKKYPLHFLLFPWPRKKRSKPL